MPNWCLIDAWLMPEWCWWIAAWMMSDWWLNDAALMPEWCRIDAWMMLSEWCWVDAWMMADWLPEWGRIDACMMLEWFLNDAGFMPEWCWADAWMTLDWCLNDVELMAGWCHLFTLSWHRLRIHLDISFLFVLTSASHWFWHGLRIDKNLYIGDEKSFKNCSKSFPNLFKLLTHRS